MTNTDIRLFGLGCNLSRNLHANTQAAAKELGLNVSIEEVSDIQEMMDLGITAIPALQIGEQVVASGRILEVEEIKSLLQF
ncbi:MAG: thioredoxin family protein [Mameliella sp.]|nr:thioredoxin family protein [Phaeodactylibacter sp.]NRA50209.1 thioredoxin family protein [Phaeodactylibacter sp.]